jgi:hypothetical protein
LKLVLVVLVRLLTLKRWENVRKSGRQTKAIFIDEAEKP